MAVKTQMRIWFPECEAMLCKWWGSQPTDWIRDKINDHLRFRANRDGYGDYWKATVSTLENKAVRLGMISEGEVQGKRNNARRISAHVKRAVLKRGKCKKCGSQKDLEVDHIIPVAEGGTSKRSNLQCLCRECNFNKGVVSNDRFFTA